MPQDRLVGGAVAWLETLLRADVAGADVLPAALCRVGHAVAQTTNLQSVDGAALLLGCSEPPTGTGRVGVAGAETMAPP